MKQKKKSKLQKRIEDSNSKYWRNKGDYLWRNIIVLKAGNKCVVCNATEYIQAHHMIPREMGSHRHEINNGISLCPSCHKYSYIRSAHKAPVAFYGWLSKNKPEIWAWLLIQEPTKSNITDYKIIVEQLSIKLDELNCKLN